MNKIIYGIISVLIGYLLFILIIDASSKPTNIGLSLRPIESLDIYFFGFVWIMGNTGWVIGTLLLLAYLALFYFIGLWIYKKTHRIKN